MPSQPLPDRSAASEPILPILATSDNYDFRHCYLNEMVQTPDRGQAPLLVPNFTKLYIREKRATHELSIS